MGGILSGIVSAVSHPVRSAQQFGHAEMTGLGIAGHDIARGYRHPALDPGHGFNPYDVIGQLGHQAVSMFNPRTRAGLANIASIFAGGPRDGFEGEMAMRQVPGHFVPYSAETGTALDRGLTNEGPIRPGKGYNPSIQKMVERAHTNPFVRASREVSGQQLQNALEKQTALDLVRTQAARAMQSRRQIDERLGSAPMQAQHPWEGDVSASHLHGQSEIAHPNFMKALLQRRYQAQNFHNHN